MKEQEYLMAKEINDRKNQLYQDLQKVIDENYKTVNGKLTEKIKQNPADTNEETHTTGV
jgi:hypothetical protein